MYSSILKLQSVLHRSTAAHVHVRRSRIVHAGRRRACRGVAYLQQHVLLLGDHVHAVLKVVTAKVDGLHQDLLIAIDLSGKEGRRERGGGRERKKERKREREKERERERGERKEGRQKGGEGEREEITV